MTWVIGTSSLFGYGAVISDIQVAFSNGETRDMLQKAYPVGNFIVAGISGSVKIGFTLLESLHQFLRLPPEKAKTNAWDPVFVAEDWQPVAKAIWHASDENEKTLGSKILLVGAHPTENLGVSHAHQIYIIRLEAPNYEPGIMKKPLSVCSIGSGSGVASYKRFLREYINIRSSSMELEMMGFGGWANALGHFLRREIDEAPMRGISKHLHVFALRRGQLLQTNNNETTLPKEGEEPIVFKMPEVATSYQEFIDMVNLEDVNANCAIT